MAYIDGMVCPVRAADREAYIEHAKKAAAVFREYGATRVTECWGTEVPEGKLTSFPMAVKLEEGEVAVFSWIEWPDRTAHDAAWEKMMKDERMQMSDMPFDGKRMIYGSFEMVLDA